jgi:hypothetical protein
LATGVSLKPTAARSALVVAMVGGLVAGCAAPSPAPRDPAAPVTEQPGVAAPTPGTQLTELTPELAAAVSTREGRRSEAGLNLVQSTVSFRPGEPGDVQLAPRAVYRVLLADPNAGWVMIYDLSSPDAAGQAGRSFAAYLRSGVGQTNYPRDAQFSVNQLGGTLVFSWWSRERTSDAQQAEAAFDVIRGVGTPIEVIR